MRDQMERRVEKWEDSGKDFQKNQWNWPSSGCRLGLSGIQGDGWFSAIHRRGAGLGTPMLLNTRKVPRRQRVWLFLEALERASWRWWLPAWARHMSRSAFGTKRLEQGPVMHRGLDAAGIEAVPSPSATGTLGAHILKFAGGL